MMMMMKNQLRFFGVCVCVCQKSSPVNHNIKSDQEKQNVKTASQREKHPPGDVWTTGWVCLELRERWTPTKITPRNKKGPLEKERNIYNPSIFGFDVNFQGCIQSFIFYQHFFPAIRSYVREDLLGGQPKIHIPILSSQVCFPFHKSCNLSRFYPKPR